ncbi:MAG: hypothetical protein COB83_09000 [Gammaproteobacteria bacterium]|nr:MAG: hypothetical protein COB83_09000 [Gammaproteobacteria bacterium]
MSITFGEKLKLIRSSTGLSQQKFADFVGLGISSYKKNEGGFTEVGLSTVHKISSHPELKKYALWLISGGTNPAAGQIAPGDAEAEKQVEQQALVQKEFDQQVAKTIEDSILLFCHIGWFTPNPDKIDWNAVGPLILKDIKPLLKKMPQQQQHLHLIDKTG